jgi:hypothetical protein
MANFCLAPQLADQFKKDIVSGKINPEKLASMTSAERHAFFAESMGDTTATQVNTLFESKLLLKNKQAGMISWARKVMGETLPRVGMLFPELSRWTRFCLLQKRRLS